jgi:hypothetical protein
MRVVALVIMIVAGSREKKCNAISVWIKNSEIIDLQTSQVTNAKMA